MVRPTPNTVTVIDPSFATRRIVLAAFAALPLAIARSARGRDDTASALHQDAGARQRLRRARRHSRADRARAGDDPATRGPPPWRRLRPGAAGGETDPRGCRLSLSNLQRRRRRGR